MVKFDYSNSSINDRMIFEFDNKVKENHKWINDNKDDEKEFLGWVDLPVNYDKEEFERIKKAAVKIQNDSDFLIVIGIGGSYLGARAVIEALTNNFYNKIINNKHKYIFNK